MKSRDEHKNTCKICVIGNESMLFPFLQFGFNTFTPSSDNELRSFLNKAIDENYGIIYIEDSYCFKVDDIIEKCKNNLTPVFIPIGENPDGTSYHQQMVDKMMETAIGINII